jgi:DNA-binding response OmpR family regulator
MATFARKKILVLDDDEDTLFILKERLKFVGYEVFTGVDGLEGLVKIRKALPDLIILDAVMPKIDGYEFFKAVKQNEAYVMIPVIILTGQTSLRTSFEALGCDYFATKPFDAQEITEKVEELLKRRVLVVSSDSDFREKMKQSFPHRENRLSFLNYPNEMYRDLGQNRYHLAVVRYAEIKESPEKFMQAVRDATLNHQLLTVIYSDAFVDGLDQIHNVIIERHRIRWLKTGNVLFYDFRLAHVTLGEFLKEHSELAHDPTKAPSP